MNEQRRLRTNAIDSKPREAMWSDMYEEERYQSWETTTVELDGAEVTVVSQGGWTCAVVVDGVVHEEWDESLSISEETFDAALAADTYGTDGPMMNYWYPIGDDLEPLSAAVALPGPLCVVEVDGEWGLALTGGGMDLSWEICAAFIALGYLPPAHFADLPEMAERWTETKQATCEAMTQSLEHVIRRAEYRLQRLARLRRS